MSSAHHAAAAHGQAVAAPGATLLATARELAVLFAQGAAERDRERRFPHAELGALKRSGILGLRVPAELGGPGGTVADYVRIVAILAEGDSSLAQLLITHTYGVDLLMKSQLAPAERLAWARRLVDDGLFVANANTERGTKTIFDFKTTLTEQADGSWLLDGTKFYSTGSGGGDVLYVSGRVTGAAAVEGRDLGTVRMTFLERDTPGLVIHDDWRGMGQRTTASGTTELHQVRVPAERCVPTDGFDGPDSLFALIGQAGFAAVYAGNARAALHAGIAYVRQSARPWPHAGVERAVDDPYVLQHVGRLQTLVSASDALLERAASAVERAELEPGAATRAAAAVAVSESKALSTEVTLEVSSRIFEICGAGATVEQHGLDRFWRDARTLTVHDPVDYKYRLIGEWALNDVPPPVTSFT